MANQWENLLHYSNNENQVISDEFFLSESSNRTPKEELESTIKLLNSKDGNIIACNFPARYNYLKSNNYQISNYDLSKCSNLNSFISDFSKDKLSLVFTSEYVNSPASAFGHTMLLFHNQNQDLDIGDAIHFAAETPNSDNFFTFAYKGSIGDYNGYFLRESFYKKMYEYNTLEQRYMYIYTLDFTKDEILQIIYHLYELRKATFKYYFLDGNCATQTTDLLNIINNNKREDKIYYLPIDTIKEYQKRIVSKFKYIPLVNKLNLLLEKMTQKEKELFNKIIKTNEDIKEEYPDIIKEAMVSYSTFYFRRFHRVYKNYDSAMEQAYIKQSIVDKTGEPLQRTQPSNLGIGLFNQNNQDYFQFHYRPLFIGLHDIQTNSLQESEVNIFTFDFIMNNKTSKLNKLDLLNIKSYPQQLNFYQPISWSIYSGLHRENKYNDLKFVNEFGVGRTNNFFNQINTTFFLSAGLENIKIYLKPSLNISSYLSNNSKIGINTYYKQFDNKSFHQTKCYLSIKKDNLLYQLNLNYDKSEMKKSYLLNIKYNF